MVVVVVVAFCSHGRIFGERLDDSFSTCTFFSVEISSRAPYQEIVAKYQGNFL